MFLLVFVLLLFNACWLFFLRPDTEPAPTTFLTQEHQSCRILDIKQVSRTAKIFKLKLPSNTLLGLPAGKHLKLRCPNTFKQETWNNAPNTEQDKEFIERKYTPISDEDQLGHFELIIKLYESTDKFPDGGRMSKHLASLHVGDHVQVSGPVGLHRYLGDGTFQKGRKTVSGKALAMIAGGSGITPILQLVRKVIQEQSGLKLSLLYANQSPADIICFDELMALERDYPEQFSAWFTVDQADDTSWKYSTGYIDQNMIQDHLHLTEDTLVLMCGPPPMIKYACLPNLEKLGVGVEKQLVF